MVDSLVSITSLLSIMFNTWGEFHYALSLPLFKQPYIVVNSYASSSVLLMQTRLYCT